MTFFLNVCPYSKKNPANLFCRVFIFQNVTLCQVKHKTRTDADTAVVDIGAVDVPIAVDVVSAVTAVVGAGAEPPLRGKGATKTEKP